MVTQVSFATFNLRNLQLPGVDRYRRGDAWSEEEYAAKVAWTATKLGELDADVVGFQELWHRDALVDVLAAAGMTANHQLLAETTGDRIANALVVRAPHEVEEVTWIERFPARFRLRATGEPTVHGAWRESAAGTDYTMHVDLDAFSRPVLRARLKLHQSRRRPRVEVYVAHLKSKRPTVLDRALRDELDSPDEVALGTALSTTRRIGEAAALRLLLNDVMDGDQPVVVLGDLNDAQLSDVLEVVSAGPGIRLFASSRTGFRSTRGLYPTATLQELRSLRDVYFTHIHEGIRQSLDHVLVSQHFYDFADARLWSFRQLRCLNDHLDVGGEPVAESDHAPIVATFDLNPAD